MTASWTFFDGEWRPGNVPLIGSMTQAVWLASIVFDGARAFDGYAPDLDLHAARAIESAHKIGLAPKEGVEEIVRLSREGIRKFPDGTALYVRSMFFGEGGFIIPEPDSARFALVVHELPMPDDSGFTACRSTFRRPSPETAVTDAKASALYPNVARALAEAKERGFDNAVKLDLNGNVAEFATSNLFMVKGGVAYTPTPNGTFLNGITKQRVAGLLQADDVEVVECRITWNDLMAADEIFSTGNYGKVLPCVRLEDRDFAVGPVAKRARTLYFDFAKQHPV